MLRLAADENFNHNAIRGLLRRCPQLDLVRVQDVGLAGADDPEVLAWAASEGRILLTHDLRTIPRYGFERVRVGQPMPGVFAVPRRRPLAEMLDEILLLAECSFEGEWEGIVLYLPLRW